MFTFIRPAKLEQLTQKGSYARSLTSACLVLPLIGTVLMFMEHQSHWPIWALIMPAFVTWMVMPTSILRLFDMYKNLDEREKEFQRRAYAFSYRVMAMLTAACIWAITFSIQEFELSLAIDHSQSMAVFITYTNIFIYLPMAYVAWRMPPPIDDDID